VNRDFAQFCLNGHLINPYFTTENEENKNFCSQCGEDTIHNCPTCEYGILGGQIDVGPFDPRYENPKLLRPPLFCYECGEPYPWTVSNLKTARELTQELEGLNKDEKEVLSKDLDDLIRDTPRTELATTRFKRLMAKAKGDAVPAIRSFVIEFGAELAKKLLQP